MISKVKYLSSIVVPVSLGELIDKITILEIKQIHITGINLKNVDKSLSHRLHVKRFYRLYREIVERCFSLHLDKRKIEFLILISPKTQNLRCS